MERDICELHASFCTVFGHPHRLRILELVGKRERCVGDLATELGTSASNVSQHLRLMKDRRAVIERREGQRVFYRLRNRKFLRAANLVREALLEEFRKVGEAAEV